MTLPQTPGRRRGRRTAALVPTGDGVLLAVGTAVADPPSSSPTTSAAPGRPSARRAPWAWSGDGDGRPAPRWWRLAVLGVGAAVAFGVFLRFYTHADMWLDEALTVDIARLPVRQIPAALRRDGAPPLFYVLLHFWMGLVGTTSDTAVRALSGIFSVATLPLVWVAGRRLGGRTAAVTALLIVASSPFAIYYGTEARMYALVGFLVAAGTVAIMRGLEQPRPGNVATTGLCTAALLYTHYWALYLVLVTGLWLLWVAWRGPEQRRRPARWLFGAMVIGSLTFVPWLPIFVFQARHTGTPWAQPADFAAMVNAVSSFAGGGTNQGRALGLLFFALAGLGFFGVARSARTIELDLRGQPRARVLGWVFLATIVVAIVGGYVSKSAFEARYAMVIFVPLVLLIGLGATTFADRRVRAGVIGAAVVFGFVASVPNIANTRTEAGQVAAVLARLGRPGDVVAFCPDQLGPDVHRLLPADRYQQVTYPRGTGPAFVDWVDYKAAIDAASTTAFARRLEAMSAPDHQIWYVWMGGYQGYGTRCQQIETDLLADPQLGAHEVVAPANRYFEPMELVRFVHLGS
jgi:mannosyltransferase